jgi:hypothetical protein
MGLKGGPATMARYKWTSAAEWLQTKVALAASNNDAAELANICNTLIVAVDNDQIQDDFQSEMDADGFFRDLDVCASLTREACVTLLEGISIECYDSETVEDLRAAVESNIEDGTLDYAEVQNA